MHRELKRITIERLTEINHVFIFVSLSIARDAFILRMNCTQILNERLFTYTISKMNLKKRRKGEQIQILFDCFDLASF